MVRRLHELAGGTDNIIMYTCVNENAIPFYEKIVKKILYMVNIKNV